jgi:hypothetical protein
MNGKRLIFTLLLFSLLFSVVFVLANPGDVRGQMTIPTRTPVPGNDSPTDTPPDDNGGGGNGGGSDNGGGGGQASPTNTPSARNTVAPFATYPPASATSTAATTQQPETGSTDIPATGSAPSATISRPQINALAPGSTPISFPAAESSFPAAGPCGEPPTFTALTTANVYLGPGSDYPVSETLGAKEVRPIVGRAAFATWWLIQLDSKYTQGWISDKAGTVQGYTGSVPIIIAPAINGVFPTPGPQWDPTPAPICTPAPSPTGDTALVSGTLDDGSTVANAQDAQNTDNGQVSSESAQTTENGNASTEARGQFAAAARPLEVPTSSTPTPNLLPIAGLVLVIAAVFVALFLRRSPRRSGPSS